MKNWCKYGMVAALAFVLSLSMAAAADGAKKSVVSEREAIANALHKVGGGSVMEIALEPDSAYSMLIVNESNRFDVRVDANSGKVVQIAKRDIHGTKPLPRGMAGLGARLNSDDVEATALAVSGGGTVVKSDRESRSNGRSVYEFEIINDGKKYIVEIDANSGDLVQYVEKSIRSGDIAVASR